MEICKSAHVSVVCSGEVVWLAELVVMVVVVMVVVVVVHNKESSRLVIDPATACLSHFLSSSF